MKVFLDEFFFAIWMKVNLTPTHVIDALQEISQLPGGTYDWFSFLRKNLCQVTTRSNPLQSILQPILRPIQGILPV